MDEILSEKTFDLKIFRKLLSLIKPFYPNLIIAIFFMLLSASSELFLPIIIKNVIDKVLNLIQLAQIDQFPLGDIALYFGILVVSLVSNFLSIFFLTMLSQNLIIILRQKLYAHFLGQSLAWHQEQRVGKLVSALTSDLDTLSDFVNNLISGFLRDIFMMIGVVLVILSVDFQLGLITVSTFPLVIVLILFFRLQSRHAFRRVRQSVSRLNTFLNEHLSGMSIIQLFAQVPITQQKFAHENEEALQASLGEMYVNATFRPLIDVLLSISLGMIIWFGGSMVLEEVLTLGTLIAFIELSRLFFGPVGEFAEYFSITQSAMSGSERIFKFLEQSSSIPNFGELEFPNTNVQIEFKNISFGYHPDDTVLHDLSFVVPANKTVAIVGYTGAGKTTITNLISRFWDPTQGQILVNTVDLRQFRLESLRQNVQSVLQDVQLFHGTIRENVTLGRNISAQDLESAAHRSRLSKVLVRLDKGWETELSNNGSNLSAGERQLVSFARVLCQNPSVLILDEATANIDSETEKWIQEALAEVVQNRTSIIIAHRLSTIKNADFILVLDQGKLVEAGTHQELLEKHGMFYNLYKLQFQVH
jgi:ATP-binding cassette subfamily B multidrug efflux pump